MMKSAEDRLSGDLADSLDRPVTRRIPIQGQMRSEFGAIPGVTTRQRRKKPAETPLIQRRFLSKQTRPPLSGKQLDDFLIK